MKKILAFVLCAALSCGFVGCELPGMGLARRIVGSVAGVDARTVFEELSKEGELIEDTYLEDTYSESTSGVEHVDRLVFRMPEEKRDASTEDACYIEIYQNEEDLNKSVDKYNDVVALGAPYYIFSSGNILLLLDSTLSADVVEKYSKAFKKATGKQVQVRQTKELNKHKGYNSHFSISNGINAEKVFYALKESMNPVEFFTLTKDEEPEKLVCILRKDNGLTCPITIEAYLSNSAAAERKEDIISPYDGTGLKNYLFISGNIAIDSMVSLPEGSEEKIKEVLGGVTGQTVEVSYW